MLFAPFVSSDCLLASARCRSPFRRLDEALAAGGVCEHAPGIIRGMCGVRHGPSAGFLHFKFKGPGGRPLRRFSAGTPGRAKFVSRAGRRAGGPGPSGPDEKGRQQAQ